MQRWVVHETVLEVVGGPEAPGVREIHLVVTLYDQVYLDGWGRDFALGARVEVEAAHYCVQEVGLELGFGLWVYVFDQLLEFDSWLANLVKRLKRPI